MNAFSNLAETWAADSLKEIIFDLKYYTQVYLIFSDVDKDLSFFFIVELLTRSARDNQPQMKANHRALVFG